VRLRGPGGLTQESVHAGAHRPECRGVAPGSRGVGVGLKPVELVTTGCLWPRARCPTASVDPVLLSQPSVLVRQRPNSGFPFLEAALKTLVVQFVHVADQRRDGSSWNKAHGDPNFLFEYFTVKGYVAIVD